MSALKGRLSGNRPAMRNYPPSGKMPLIISVAGVQQHLFWFYPQQPFEEMCETLSAMLNEIPVTGDSVPA